MNQISEAMEQWFPSPNYTQGRSHSIDRIVIHSTRGGAAIGTEAEGTVRWFLNPNSEASAHLLVTQAGQFIHFVADENQVWGAGERPGHETGDKMNQRSLQVELEQPDNETPFSDIQIARLAEAVLWWANKWGIPLDADHVLAHEATPSGKAWGKTDVGKMFDWEVFWALLAE